MTPSPPAGHRPANTIATPARGRESGPRPSADTSVVRLIRLVLLYTAARLTVIVALVALLIGVDRVFGLGLPLMLSSMGALLAGVAISAVAFRSLRRRINQDVIAIDDRRRDARAQR
ncbi:DUF4229 domain-containing protein [Rhodococcus opacus]|uniref:DUF4229 domain-containing protein n=1 Tax=Rhodococcus opacus TaxID=37919 RepID=UPI0029C4D374|nr:DUF4229 domain-containing protein [Rhodococcus opacus]MDX5962097.1 DUF4229 domain-containing protein [Rhodococcus opacus]